MRTVTGVLLAAVALASNRAFAAEDMSDEAFAELPVVVVARWTKEAPRDRHRIGGGLGASFEQQTSIIVDRVIRGKIKPGKHVVLLQDHVRLSADAGVLWRQGPLGAGEPEHISVPMDSLSAESVWCLYRGRGCDPEDKRRYLILDRIRAVQPGCLEPYFRALVQPEPAASVAKLLAHPDVRVVARALAFLCGGRMPWPNNSYLDYACRSDWIAGPPRTEFAEQVKPLLRHRDFSLRMHAIGAYAVLAGESALPELRRALQDPDVEPCTAAVGALASRRDEASIDAIVRAAVGTLSRTNSTFDITAECVMRIAEWNEDRLVPALICVLQSNPAVHRPESPDKAALLAQQVLLDQVGFAFPLDRVQECLAAWQSASRKKDRKLRIAALRAKLGPDNLPLRGKIVADVDQASGFTVELVNHGTKPITLPREPTGYYFEFGAGATYRLWLGPQDEHSYVTLRTGERLRSHIPIPMPLMVAKTRRASAYASFGTPHRGPAPGGVDYWKGVVSLQLPPRQERISAPVPKLEAEVRKAIARLLELAREEDVEKARQYVSWVHREDLESWRINEAYGDRGAGGHTAFLLGVLRAALGAGAAEILRIDVLAGQDSRRRGPPLYVKVRFGAGPAADTLLLVMRRVDGTLLLGRILTY